MASSVTSSLHASPRILTVINTLKIAIANIIPYAKGIVKAYEKIWVGYPSSRRR